MSRVEIGPPHKRVLEIIEQDRDELVNLCLELGRIDSFAGREREAAEFVTNWLGSTNQGGADRSWLQPITDRSANGIGLFSGVGGGRGRSLIFDAHIDTDKSTHETPSTTLKPMSKGFVEGDMLYGSGIVNDKAQVAAFMIAASALRRAGVRLTGDLTVAAVAFETGASSVDEHQGIDQPGEGFGSRWLVDRGVVADYALVGETSNFGIITVECGVIHVKVRVPGRPVYTPRLERPDTLGEQPNAFVKAAGIVTALESWSSEYERAQRVELPGGAVVVPKAQVIAVRGSGPHGLGNTECNIYFEAWIAPGVNPKGVVAQISDVTKRVGVECEVSLYQWSRGYVAKNAEGLIAAVAAAHRSVLGTEPPRPPSSTLSMWRDLNAFNEVGIPSVCYGPPRQRESYSFAQNRAMKIDDLVSATKVYALTAMAICDVQA